MSSSHHPPVVLDCDGAVAPLPGELRIALQADQEALRFGCSLARMRTLRKALDAQLPPPSAHGTVWMGSGDFHHLSWPLIARQAEGAARPLRVVVLDNHPDNMRYWFGVHCGSWVRRVAALPGVAEVLVVGITSPDIGPAHWWENHLGPLRRGRLQYWSTGVDTRWAQRLGLGAAFRSFDSVQLLANALCQHLQHDPRPTYLSIDKDVLSPDTVRTNWDQGQLTEPQLMAVIAALHGQLVGSDITGEVSVWRYRSWLKRWLSAGDGQDATGPDAATLAQWQAAQNALNQRLLAPLAAARHFAR